MGYQKNYMYVGFAFSVVLAANLLFQAMFFPIHSRSILLLKQKGAWKSVEFKLILNIRKVYSTYFNRQKLQEQFQKVIVLQCVGSRRKFV